MAPWLWWQPLACGRCIIPFGPSRTYEREQPEEQPRAHRDEHLHRKQPQHLRRAVAAATDGVSSPEPAEHPSRRNSSEEQSRGAWRGTLQRPALAPSRWGTFRATRPGVAPENTKCNATEKCSKRSMPTQSPTAHQCAKTFRGGANAGSLKI